SVNKKYFADANRIKNHPFHSAKSITTKVRFVPVVFHILYDTISNDIPDQRVYSQLKVLNDDFLAMNANLYQTQQNFVSKIGVAAVQFYVANKAPNGADTLAIIHKHTSVKKFPFNNDVKHNSTNGDDAWNTDKYLNIWICIQSNSSILGYSSFPGTGLMNNGNDGTVVNMDNFGLSGNQNAPYDLGRTLTHELGHYLGLYHTFEFGCTDDGDSIKDTPPVLTSHSGCDKGTNTCSNDTPDEIDMVENFMDYSDDNCMTMFSMGQVAVMNSVLKNIRDSLGYDSVVTFTTQIGIENATTEKSINQIYPNPTSEILMINSNDKIIRAEIFNAMGQLMKSDVFKIDNSSIHVELIPSGNYLLKVLFENGNFETYRFQKK
ncbi:MAG: hypothetical protein RL065_1299, partial [Bacteroidota bacterium]